MKNVSFPYGKELIPYNFENENFNGVLVSKLHGYNPDPSIIAIPDGIAVMVDDN